MKGRTLDPNVVIPLIDDAPPTFKFFSIPTPPSTITDPVSLFVDSVVFVKDAIPDVIDCFKNEVPVTPKVLPTAICPPILRLPAIPTPPLTTSAPSVVLVVCDVSSTERISLITVVPAKESRVKFPVGVLIVLASEIPTSILLNLAPNVAVRTPTTLTLPLTSSFDVGTVVPIPRFPAPVRIILLVIFALVATCSKVPAI